MSARLWSLPFTARQINDTDPGHEGPSCAPCAEYQADRRHRAEQCPMLTGDNGQMYRSPHAGTYLFEERYSRWACTQGAHGPLDQWARMQTWTCGGVTGHATRCDHTRCKVVASGAWSFPDDAIAVLS